MRIMMFLCALLLAGCAAPVKRPNAEAEAYQRGYRQAVKEQYWIIQNQQRNSATK